MNKVKFIILYFIIMVFSDPTVRADEDKRIFRLSKHLAAKTFSESYGEDFEIRTKIENISKDGSLVKTNDGIQWKISWINQWTSYTWKVGDSVRPACWRGSVYLENLSRGNSISAECKSVDLQESMTFSTVAKVKSPHSIVTLRNNLSFQIPVGKEEFSKWSKGDPIIVLCMSGSFFSGDTKHFALWNLSLNQIFEYCIPHPEFQLSGLSDLESLLNERIRGQEEAVRETTGALMRYYIGLHNTRTPIGKFLFLGPTGVGKTELAKQLSIEVSPLKSSSLIRFNMGEFVEPHSIARLIGSPPGYVNHEDGGELTNSVMENPYSFVLIDEFEKAHKNVRKFFLGVLDEGYVVDAQRNYVDFSNTFFIFTSNISGLQIYDLSREGCSSEEILSSIERNISSTLSPELLNRLEPVVFHPLSQENIEDITRLHLEAFLTTLKKELGITLVYDEDFVIQTSRLGYSPEFGARPLIRHIEGKIITSISKKVIRENIPSSSVIHIEYDSSGEISLYLLR